MPRARAANWAGSATALAVAALVGVVWEASVRLSLVHSRILPAPTAIAAELVTLLDGKLATNIVVTLTAVATGLVLGGTMGLFVGVAMGWSERVRTFADPFIAAIHPLPKLALLPILMVFFGLGELPKILVIAATTFFPMALNAMTGVRQIDATYFEVALNHGATRRQILRRIVIPGSLPMLLAGIRLATNLALITAIAVEMISGKAGLGAQLWLAWQVMNVELLFATMFVIGAIGVILNQAMRALARRAAPWLSERTLVA